MDGRKRMLCDDMGTIKKGPWKAEEDEVLINHVNKYGPRDWSSIRSKGLLQRTGKSCRLRWVNKLRPNLKNGVKFSAEEERTVIDLQAQFGNKWAKIATYLPGRTDNDVKNFWSSRQKRLARILQTSAPPCGSKPRKNKEIQVPPLLDGVPSLEAPIFSMLREEESIIKSRSCSSPYIDDSETIKMVPLQGLMYPGSLNFEHSPHQIEFNPAVDKQSYEEQQLQLPFPQILQLQPDYSLPVENQDFITRLGDPNFYDVFGQCSGSELGTGQLPILPSCFGPDGGSHTPSQGENQNIVTPDSFIDDFPPMDIFDHLDPLPSPSQW
ncbi:transcription factor DUO1-like [Olea europaea var. sylvestris]|uniref:transcription factor DUO1-like n=1 Tax=Olea europaea var. sylvestris TaxID=158386 RepID=UPI000C1D1BBB|nr:transcription factor DUO1-like [Olea europaea var. sylvestris]